jgi:hypothetical protein
MKNPKKFNAFVKRGGGGLEPAKIAGVLVRLNHVASLIVNANHSIM